MSRRLLTAALVLLVSVSYAGAQFSARRLTTLESLRQYPNFFNLQNVLIRGEFAASNGRVMLQSDERQMQVLLGDVKTTSGPVEVRAQLLDVGRLEPTDPRLARYEGSREPDKWPKPGEELLLNVTGVTAVEGASTATVRTLALEPWKFEGQSVTITGQFRGRNLFGDLPGSPAKSNFDFVLRGGEGAIWISGLRPKGKGFDLNVDARVDTNRWLQITGIVTRQKTMVTIEAKSMTVAQAPRAQPVADDETPAPPPMPAEVVFSSPTDAEVDVPLTSAVRLQFSRGLNPATLSGNIKATYMGDAAPLEFQSSYDNPNRAVELRFSKPLEPLRTVTIETLEGLRTFDGAPVTPWKLTFSLAN